ncbi:MAG: hypothetical protein ACR2IE_13630 [Candidatus Sumerlaeaceae bacterium]
MDKNTVAWISIVLVIIALLLAFFQHYYAAWGVVAVDVGLLIYAIRKK